MSLWKTLLGSSFVQSFATKEVRHLATAAAGALASWLVAHNAAQSDATSMAEGISALIIGAGGYGLSLLNASNSEARVQVAAQTGQVVSGAMAQAIVAQSGVIAQQNADQGQANKTAAAIAHIAALPDAGRDAALARLTAGAA